MSSKIQISKKNKKLEQSLDDKITKINLELTKALEESKVIRLKLANLIQELDSVLNKKYTKSSTTSKITLSIDSM